MTAKTLCAGLAMLGMVGFAGRSQGQNVPVVLRCGTAQAVEASLAAHPEKRLALEALERFTRNRDLARRAARPDAEPVRIIPVVFHIIHNFGNENISDAQVRDAIRVMNLDYSFTSNDTGSISPAFRPIAAQVNFEFRLAQKDPFGNCTNGVTRTISTATEAAGEQVKDLISWDTRRYLNIWVVRSIAIGAGGYAYYPGAAPQQSHEGIVVLAQQTGSIGASGGSNLAVRTLSHEAGHYFNLAHTWGNSNEPGLASNCNMDDGVTDTPNTIGTGDQSCNLGQTTCGVLDNVENYMDYSSCGRMFTLGQKDRMRAASESAIAGRSNLWSAANLAFTGVTNLGPRPLCPPVVAISRAGLRTCTGSNITYKASVSGADLDSTLSFLWTMPGATPSTSTSPSPVVAYNSPGQYDVRLKVTNSAGYDVDSIANAVFIYSDQPAYTTHNYEGFEDPAFPIINGDPFQPWEFATERQGVNWGASTVGAFEGTHSLRITAQSLSNGQTASATSPTFDLRGLSRQSYLSFRMASARRSLSNQDELRIYFSTNCGKTYNQRFTRSGTNPTTGAYTNLALFSTPFRPTASDWRRERVSLVSVLGATTASELRVRFELKGGGGNAFHIDSVALIDPTITGVQNLTTDNEPTLSPNPAFEEVTLTLPASSGQSTYEVYNIQGALMLSGQAFGQVQIPVKRLPQGAYLVKVQLAAGPWQQRLVVTY